MPTKATLTRRAQRGGN